MRHLSEQYLTSSQTFSHFLRQVKGRPQVAQVFCGSSDFLIIFAMSGLYSLNDSCAGGAAVLRFAAAPLG